MNKDNMISRNQKKNYQDGNNVLLTLEKQNKALNESLSDKTALVEEYKSKNDMLLSDLKEYKQYKVEMEEYKKLLADAQGKNIDKDNIIKDKDLNISELNKNVEDLK